LKKRSKKLFDLGARVATGTRANMQKFFASFFQKRSPSFPNIAPTTPAP
jgi:hypothetical protein